MCQPAQQAWKPCPSWCHQWLPCFQPQPEHGYGDARTLCPVMSRAPTLMETEGMMGMLRQGLSSSKSSQSHENQSSAVLIGACCPVANGNTVGILPISLVGEAGLSVLYAPDSRCVSPSFSLGVMGPLNTLTYFLSGHTHLLHTTPSRHWQSWFMPCFPRTILYQPALQNVSPFS